MDSKDEEKIGDVPKEFGNVIDALHNKSKISSLRTFQGDMAEYIKEKSESVVSVALKEKERKEEREEKAGIVYQTPKPEKDGLQINLTIILASLALLLGAVAVSVYVYSGYIAKSADQRTIEPSLIPYNNSSGLANVTQVNIGAEMAKADAQSGINIFKITDANNMQVKKTQEFFNMLQIPLPGNLERTIRNDFVLGTIPADGGTAHFLIITVNDFGAAFSGMLEWEPSLNVDMAWLKGADSAAQVSGPVAWKDLIVKNKDIRAAVDGEDKALLAYTFLDKNTILIISDISAIGEIASAYASRSVAR